MNKKTVLLATAALSLIIYMLIPVWSIPFLGMSLTGLNLLNLGQAIAILPILCSAAVLVCSLVGSLTKYKKYATWSMGVAALWVLIQGSLGIGAFLYLACAVFAIAVPFINQIPEEEA
ncbi:MAG: hypothetical protein KBT12_05490 [Bacteroidales bacterium]|nr:hypothetical protein [Candidatus Physcousia equi]